ncbi:MAG TPA: peptide chain release factor 2 [Clostridiales bacterium]|nr:peptide chain release factor 2 [Clostridiales bacterium]
MIDLEEIKQELKVYDARLKELKESLDIANLEEKTKDMEEIIMNPDFWNEPDKGQEVLQKMKQTKDKVATFYKLSGEFEDLDILIGMAIEENDASLVPEIKEGYKKFLNDFEEIRLNTLLYGEYDKSNAIITLHSGAGGTEACDWVEMLFRMYSRWAEKKGYKTEILDYLEGDEAGIKSVTVQINGENVYGYLKGEKGVHRLIRISPFDSGGRRHTSFASCDVMPEINDDVNIDIKDDDIRIDTYRASGAGGQHINKTDSAIRITHIPTGIVVQCQNERSQHKNKDRAMKMLKAKLYERQEEENEMKIKNIQGELSDISWGSQIRSYVFCPYTMVKDHRTNTETGNVNAVMDGEIDIFINQYLNWKVKL